MYSLTQCGLVTAYWWVNAKALGLRLSCTNPSIWYHWSWLSLFQVTACCQREATSLLHLHAWIIRAEFWVWSYDMWFIHALISMDYFFPGGEGQWSDPVHWASHPGHPQLSGADKLPVYTWTEVQPQVWQSLTHWSPWWQGSWGQHGAHLGPTGPRWAPCWPHELCYLGPQWNVWYFADFRYIFWKENICVFIQISLKFVPKGAIVNKSALVQVMAWHLTWDKPLP